MYHASVTSAVRGRRAVAGGLLILKRFGRDNRGVVALEWALGASFLMMLMLGAFIYGTAALHKMQMANAVRAGLQYAVVRKPMQGDTSQIRAVVLNAAPEDNTGTRNLVVSLLCQCPDESAVTCGGSCTGGDPGAYVSIRMTEDFDTLLRLPFGSQRLSFTAEGMVRLN